MTSHEHSPAPSGRNAKARAVRGLTSREGRGRRRKTSDDPASARRRILDAAEELIAENGFDATPTARIAKRAAVPKGLLFHYFPTKLDLLTALVAERTSVDAFEEMCDLDIEPGDVAGMLSRLADRFRQGLHTSVRMWRVIFREADTHPDVRAAIRGLYQEAVRYIRSGIDVTLAGWVRAEEIAYKQRDAVAEAFATLLIHEASHAFWTGETFDVDAIAKLLAAGLQAPAPVAAAP